MKWCLAILSMEMRKIFAYRVDFWFQMIGVFLSQFLVAYFLWKSIFAYRGVKEIGGYTFELMTAYYLFLPFVDRMVRANSSFVMATEIYDGSMTRYLVYPMSYLGFRWLTSLAYTLMTGLQMGLGFLLLSFFWKLPSSITFSWEAVSMGIVSTLFGALLYFFFAAILEMMAFWTDNVWALAVMLQFITAFLGGGLIPLSLFPHLVQKILWVTPFPYLLSVPTQAFLGQISLVAWLKSILVISLWCFFAWVIAQWIWKKGRLKFSGVGM